MPVPITGPQSSQGYNVGVSPAIQAWIVLGIFGGSFLLLLLFGHLGASLDVSV